MKRNIITLAVLISGSLAIFSCGTKTTPPPNPLSVPVPVNAFTVTRQNVIGTDTYPGTVVPLNEVELRPQVSGYITQSYVQDGQLVTKGQKLYEIDRTQYQATYAQAQANLRSTQANLERVRQDAERYENLAKQDAIARQRVDYARAELGTAQAQVAAARAGVSGASTNLRYATITAPMSGRIGIAQVKVGSQVSPGQTLINTISSDNPIAVDIVINDTEVPRFARLQQKSASDSIFSIQLSDGTIYPHLGKIQAIDRSINPQTGTITVRVSFPNPERGLIPGMSTTLRVRNADIGPQLVIPNKAITEQMGEFYTYVIQGDTVIQNKVALGYKFSDKIVVREGLKEGDKIVMEGTQKLRPGAKITLGAPQPPAAAGGKK